MATGTVKFFNPAKGFGFIAPRDGGADVFVHVSAVERSGLSELNEGDEVSYELEMDRRSGKAAAVDLAVLGSAPARPRAPRPSRPGGGFDRQGGGFDRQSGGFDRQDRSQSAQGRSRTVASNGDSGVVKWFNTQKGFGFIQPNDGTGDVFVHVSAVERSGLGSLTEGQAIVYDIQEDRRTGKPTATNLRLA